MLRLAGIAAADLGPGEQVIDEGVDDMMLVPVIFFLLWKTSATKILGQDPRTVLLRE
jgi:hypothetical protein